MPHSPTPVVSPDADHVHLRRTALLPDPRDQHVHRRHVGGGFSIATLFPFVGTTLVGRLGRAIPACADGDRGHRRSRTHPLLESELVLLARFRQPLSTTGRTAA